MHVSAVLDPASPVHRVEAAAEAVISGELAELDRQLQREDPDRFNPDGFHWHATPCHQAALVGHLEVVRLLVERGARLDIRDELWKGTPLGWAKHGGQQAAAAFLTAREERRA